MPPSQDKLENEAQLVEDAKTSDQAFEVLYNYYFPKIYGYVFKRIGNRQLAEDIISDIFLKVFTNLNKYQHQGYTFGAWIYKIATNKLIDHYRKASRHKEVELIEAQDFSNNTDLERSFDVNKDLALVKTVLAKMPKRQQEVLHLRIFADMEYEEVGEILKITPNNARVLVHRSLKNFYVNYKKYEK